MSRELFRDGSQDGSTDYTSMDADRLGIEITNPFAALADICEPPPVDALGPNSDHTASLLSLGEAELSLTYCIRFSKTVMIKELGDVYYIPEKSDQKEEVYLTIEELRASFPKRVAAHDEQVARENEQVARENKQVARQAESLWDDFQVFIKGAPNPPKIVCSKVNWQAYLKELALEKDETPKGAPMISYSIRYKVPVFLGSQWKEEEGVQIATTYPGMDKVMHFLPGRVEGISASHDKWTSFSVVYIQEGAPTKPIEYTRNEWRQYIHAQATAQAQTRAKSDREKVGVDLLGIQPENGHGGGGGKKPQKALKKKKENGADAALVDLFSSGAPAAPAAPKREDLPSAGEGEADSSVSYPPSPAPLPLRCRVSYTMPDSSTWIDEPEENARPSYKDWPALYKVLVLRMLGGTDSKCQQFTFNILQGTQYYMLHGTSEAWTNHLTQPPGASTDLIEQDADGGMYSLGRLTVFKLPPSGVKLDVINPESSARHDQHEEDGFEL